MWEIGANVEQHNHWLLEKPPLERFTALDICKFTAKCFVSCSFLLAEKRQKEQMKWQIESLCRTDLAHFFLWTGDGFERDATQP
jgi:hypothetical protein